MKIRRLSPWLAMVAFLAFAPPVSGQAQTELPKEGEGPYTRNPAATEAIGRLKSPYCPGLMLEVCPSPGGAALRDSIETLADQGWTADQLVDWVLERHGEQWRAMPERSGVGWLAWLMPPFAVVVGIGLVVVALVRMRRRQQERTEPPPPNVSPEDEARLREALKDLETEEEVPFL